ncbi:fatty-acid-binding protein 3, chloroplastic-like isoform X1 [Primulina tabacum]|uniref:fatty-acid-binding protein 3, chloroplastic-like isoform X1 n=1 Tax=Primulina tabacum TaxID=48773 RepID=UPI003F590A93
MASIAAMPTQLCLSSPTKINSLDVKPKICYLENTPSKPLSFLNRGLAFSYLSTFTIVPIERNSRLHTHVSPNAASSSSVVDPEYIEEPGTNVKFQSSLSLPGCSSLLSFLGAGYREKVFAIIGVKVYAVGLYANPTIFSKLSDWKGCSSNELQQDSLFFDAIFQASLEKSLHIILVRDVDGKTFWDALNEALSPRIKSPSPADASALSLFCSIFQGRPLKKGTSVFLTWLDPTKILVCVSSEAMPSSVDATIESSNVASALFDVFLGSNPVSPSLKDSASNGLAAALK